MKQKLCVAKKLFQQQMGKCMKSCKMEYGKIYNSLGITSLRHLGWVGIKSTQQL